jgi:hypothetical protein
MHGVRYNTLPSGASLLNRLIKRTLQIARLKELVKSLELDELLVVTWTYDPGIARINCWRQPLGLQKAEAHAYQPTKLRRASFTTFLEAAV